MNPLKQYLLNEPLRVSEIYVSNPDLWEDLTGEKLYGRRRKKVKQILWPKEVENKTIDFNKKRCYI